METCLISNGNSPTQLLGTLLGGGGGEGYWEAGLPGSTTLIRAKPNFEITKSSMNGIIFRSSVQCKWSCEQLFTLLKTSLVISDDRKLNTQYS